MTVTRQPEVQPGQPLIELHNVSRMFNIRRDRQRSLQELFIGLFGRSRQEKDAFWPIRDISLRIDHGECVGVIGPNGSGKSTLLKLITGILEPTSGDMIVRGMLSSLLELGAGFQGDLTGRENVYLNGSIYGLSRARISELMDDIIEYAELGDFIDTPVKHYSSGMYVRLGFSVAIHTSPDLLLVDEVLAVGDLSFQRKCLDSIYQFRNHGGTILLVSHDMGTIQSICNRAVWLEDGLVRNDGDPREVVSRYQRHVAEKEQAKLDSRSSSGTDSDRVDGAGGPDHQHAASRDGSDGPARWGTRELEITHVVTSDETDTPKSVFIGGETMKIRLFFTARQRIANPVFGLMIHSQEGVNIFGPNTKFSGLEIGYADGEGAVEYIMPKLQLQDGSYTISVAAVNSEDTVTYDYHDRAYTFQVYPGEQLRGYGMIALDGAWSIAEKMPTSEPVS